jgi:hypothetical protein
VLGRTLDSTGVLNAVSDAASNFLTDLASLVYVDPEITGNIQKVISMALNRNITMMSGANPRESPVSYNSSVKFLQRNY